MVHRLMGHWLFLLKTNQTDFMKIKILPVCVIFLIISCQTLISQKTGSGYYQDLTGSESCLTGEIFTQALSVDATTYFNKEWIAGDIYLSNGEVVRNKLIKYNGILDELLWKEPKSENIIKLDKEAVIQFHFQNLNGDTSVYFRKIKFKSNIITDTSEAFAQAVYTGNMSLFVLHTFKFEGTELIRKNGISYEKNVYTEEPVYIFRLTTNKTFVIKSLNRRNLYAFSPDNKEKIKKFLKENKQADTKKIDYLKRLTKFLNETYNSP